MTALYTILHMLVDGLCALAMFGTFLHREEGYFYILLYNFCAFALQMPFGVLLDMVNTQIDGGEGKRGMDPAFLTAAAGVCCTIAGAVTHPVLLGIGNALFHVGGGVGTIREDRARAWRGRGLGVFVAPGALGLYLGTWIAKEELLIAWYPWVSILTVLLCLAGFRLQRSGRRKGNQDTLREESNGGGVPYRETGTLQGGTPEWGTPEGTKLRKSCGKAAVCCLAVVILRSYVGMAVTFPWKTGMAAGTAAVLAVAAGKAAGGFSAARYGFAKTAAVSLSLAAFCYLFSFFMPVGLAALFLFNMTMPLTLYWMAESMPRLPGFAFGYLTFALFLGFLPGYFGFLPGNGGNVLGCMGSVFSLLLLGAGMGRRRE